MPGKKEDAGPGSVLPQETRELGTAHGKSRANSQLWSLSLWTGRAYRRQYAQSLEQRSSVPEYVSTAELIQALTQVLTFASCHPHRRTSGLGLEVLETQAS